MADETNMKSICKKCGKPLNKNEKGSDDENLLCGNCVIELAEQYIPEETKPSKSGQINTRRIWPIARLIILFICIIVIAMRTPKLISVAKKQKPIRQGTYSTDSQTDQCIKNLWQISRLLQEGKLPDKDLVCPASKKPYVVRTIEGDTVVTCPNPELHDLTKIQVTKKSPCPEVTK